MIRTGDFKITQLQRDYVNEILDSGRLTEGPFVKKLERELEKYLGTKHAILVANGTLALQLISMYLTHKEKRSLNVLVPAMTFPATFNAFAVGGHSMALSDINEDLQIDVSKIKEDMYEELDVVIPVHLMGYTVDMDEIMKLAAKYGWTVVEDACEAFGTEYNGKKVGTVGDFGAFSFYVSHNIAAGELGVVITDDDEAAKVMRSMKNHGRVGNSMKFLHDYVGSNFKTTEFCAAIGLANMQDVDKTLKVRRDNAKYFYDNIKNDKLKPFAVSDNVNLLGYPIRCESEKYRDEITKKLNDADIETRNIFPNLANQNSYSEFFNPFQFPVANELEKVVFYIGIHQFITEEDKKKIIKILNDE